MSEQHRSVSRPAIMLGLVLVHHVFAVAFHRAHKYFGSDQGWRNADLDYSEAFTAFDPGDLSHPGYEQLVANVKAMLELLEGELGGS